ncbi:DUF1521 domain-containing protein [Paraburkholderia azotifigens]|uniref:DUF1521 domain-containing protein n=1 Tax=Paraburkholderia azotifigens TaxID=2057004 RepID=UPI00318137BD
MNSFSSFASTRESFSHYGAPAQQKMQEAALSTQIMQATKSLTGNDHGNTMSRSMYQSSFSSTWSRGDNGRNLYSKANDTQCELQQSRSNMQSQLRNSCGDFKRHPTANFKMEQSYQKTSIHIDDSSRRCQNNNNWSNTCVQNGKSTIDLGDYKLDLNKSDSSMLLTNKKTGETTKVWGDPHIDNNGSSNMFKGPMSFNLQDGTKITVGTKGDGNVTYADKLTITKGNDAYVVNGLSEKNGAPLTVQREGNGRLLDAQTPDGYELVANRNGKGWIDPATGHAPTAADFKAH